MERLTAPSGYKGPQPTVKPDLVGKLSRCGHVYHVYCLVAMYNNGNKVGASSGGATTSQAAPKPGGLIRVAPRCFGWVLEAPPGFPGGSTVKNPPAMQETLVRFLGWEDTLEKG